MINQLLNSVPTQEIANNNWIKNYIIGVLHYVFYFANIVDDAEFYKELEEIEFIKKENIMGALARKIENQAMQKGMQQVALKLLQKGIERSIIVETTGLSAQEIEEISNKKPDEN
jgi:DNA-binding transcriptional regulator YhcF (GntR family)